MNAEIEKSLTRGVEWLLAQQAEGGGWHSKTYGQLKDGAGVTALTLDALSRVTGLLAEKSRAAMRRGFAFLAPGLAKRDTIASPDGSLDFPTYAAALWIAARNRSQVELPDLDVMETKLAAYLVAAQVTQARGFAMDSPSYGGWDFLGPGDAQGITTGTNISVTCHVLEALCEARGDREQGTGDRGVHAAIERGKAYALRCQQADGGFAFTCELR
jgi:hypothetical protein